MKDLEEKLLASFVDGTPSLESYVDTKAKYILQDIMPVIKEHIALNYIPKQELSRLLEDEPEPEIPRNDYYWRYRNELKAELRKALGINDE